MDYHHLSWLELCAAAALVLVNGAVSLSLKLGLEGRLIVAAVRTVVQLLLIGYVLTWVFGQDSVVVTLLLMAMMTFIAGTAAVRRVDRRFPGIWLNSITAVTASSWLVTAWGLSFILQPSDWTANLARDAVPLLGMILGNTLTGISLGLDRLAEQLASRRAEVEMKLTLGATRWEAAGDAVRQAVRTGMIPIINSMMVVGLVSLPGMMTGQLLARVPPQAAVRYQIAIMFLIAAGTALGTIGVVLLSYFRLFNNRHQFLYERIRRVSGS